MNFQQSSIKEGLNKHMPAVLANIVYGYSKDLEANDPCVKSLLRRIKRNIRSQIGVGYKMLRITTDIEYDYEEEAYDINVYLKINHFSCVNDASMGGVLITFSLNNDMTLNIMEDDNKYPSNNLRKALNALYESQWHIFNRCVIKRLTDICDIIKQAEE